MKKFFIRPGFEALFYAGLIVLFVLPAMVYAQSSNRSVSINVINNDTLINGKKISELKPAEKKEAQEALASLGTTHTAELDRIFKLRTGARIKLDSLRGGMPPAGVRMNTNRMNLFADSMGRGHNIDHMPMARTNPGIDRMPVMRPDMSGFRMPVARPGERGVITLDFNSIDKNGIPTRNNFRVSSATPEMEKKLSGSSTTDLAVVDIALVPEISTGKTWMVFTLPNTTAADVSFTDTDGKTLWTDKSTSGKFMKSFALPMNGIYYLVVKQGGKAAVRRVVKE